MRTSGGGVFDPSTRGAVLHAVTRHRRANARGAARRAARRTGGARPKAAGAGGTARSRRASLARRTLMTARTAVHDVRLRVVAHIRAAHALPRRAAVAAAALQ